MALLTAKKYAERKATPSLKKGEQEKSKVIPKTFGDKLYTLLYPEMGDVPPSFSIEGMIEGEMRRVIVRNGVLKTYDLILAQHLIKQGYQILEIKGKQ